MRPMQHIVVSLSLGAVFWVFARSFYAGLVCFVCGVFVDIDHAIEYVIHYGWKGITLKKICLACEETAKQQGGRKFRKLYLIFHIGEVAIILWILSIITKNIYLLAVAVGHSTHLILDSIGNKMYPYSYFMIWRLIKRFDAKRLFRQSLH